MSVVALATQLAPLAVDLFHWAERQWSKKGDGPVRMEAVEAVAKAAFPATAALPDGTLQTVLESILAIAKTLPSWPAKEPTPSKSSPIGERRFIVTVKETG